MNYFIRCTFKYSKVFFLYAHTIIIWVYFQLLTIFSRFNKNIDFPLFHPINKETLNEIIKKSNTTQNNSKTISNINFKDLSENRGLSSSVKILEATFLNGMQINIFMKISKYSTFNEIFRNLKTKNYREAQFYNYSKKFSISNSLPEIFYSYYNRLTGQSLILMQCFKENSFNLNYVFGNQIWGVSENFLVLKKDVFKDLDNGLIQFEYLKRVYMKSAELHSEFWNDPKLFNFKWLKACDWIQGKNRLNWEECMNMARILFINFKKNNKNSFVLDKKLECILEKSLDKADWMVMQKELKSRPFTLTHGDFHAANMLLKLSKQEDKIYFLDWSEVAIWEPMTDLGQIMISDINPTIRRKYETELIKLYWNHLIKCGVDEKKFTFELCWDLYEKGGVERFLWIFCVLLSFNLPNKLLEYFQQQILSFIEDHGNHSFYVLKPVVVI